MLAIISFLCIFVGLEPPSAALKGAWCPMLLVSFSKFHELDAEIALFDEPI
jgi:hypothetical protein